MKSLRRLTFVLLGIVLVVYLVVSIFHVSIRETTDFWTVGLYVIGGLAFIGAVVCSMIVIVWRSIQIIKSSSHSVKK